MDQSEGSVSVEHALACRSLKARTVKSVLQGSTEQAVNKTAVVDKIAQVMVGVRDFRGHVNVSMDGRE